ncbi:MAG: hypothetical protein ACKOX1_08510 [Ignavibacteria bacterium]
MMSQISKKQCNSSIKDSKAVDESKTLNISINVQQIVETVYKHEVYALKCN